MARLPAKPTSPDHSITPARAFTALEEACGALRNVLLIFKDQAGRQALPQSHVLDRLLEPLAATRAQLASLGSAITSTAAVTYAQAATGDRNQDLSAEVPAFLGALDQAAADIKGALPSLFDENGDLSYKIGQDASGRPVSRATLTAEEMAALSAIVDDVLVLIME